jgi:hypothetical protein
MFTRRSIDRSSQVNYEESDAEGAQDAESPPEDDVPMYDDGLAPRLLCIGGNEPSITSSDYGNGSHDQGGSCSMGSNAIPDSHMFPLRSFSLSLAHGKDFAIDSNPRILDQILSRKVFFSGNDVESLHARAFISQLPVVIYGALIGSYEKSLLAHGLLNVGRYRGSAFGDPIHYRSRKVLLG